jgi:hypothetical protein
MSENTEPTFTEKVEDEVTPPEKPEGSPDLIQIGRASCRERV